MPIITHQITFNQTKRKRNEHRQWISIGLPEFVLKCFCISIFVCGTYVCMYECIYKRVSFSFCVKKGNKFQFNIMGLNAYDYQYFIYFK